MSGSLLDTNVLSELCRPRPDDRVRRWLEFQEKQTLYLSAMTIGELRRGTELLVGQTVRRLRLERMIGDAISFWFDDRILPATSAIAERWGVLAAERQLAGRPLNWADGFIAATALEHGLIVVTRNEKDFAGLGVPVFNPWEYRG